MSVDNRMHSSHEDGSSLIETLVALFIMAIGLMASQTMQISSLKSTSYAEQVTSAQFLVSDMTDRIMAYDNINDTSDDADYDGYDTGAGTISDPGCAATGCSLTQQRSRDVFEWKEQIEALLPGGRGAVSFDTDTYTITVMWDKDNNGVTGTNCSGDSSTDLTCFSIDLVI